MKKVLTALLALTFVLSACTTDIKLPPHPSDQPFIDPQYGAQKITEAAVSDWDSVIITEELIEVPTPVRSIDPSKPMIALTFDDGPYESTEQILDLLELHGAVATFCVIGSQIHGNRDTLRRTVELGSEVIGHSWKHCNYTELTAEEVRRDLILTNTEIEAVTGIKPALFRPPYGRFNNDVQSVSRELGLSILNWSIDPRDWESKDPEAIFNAVIRDAYDRGIIILHDRNKETAEAMKLVIPALIELGYQLVTASELLYYSGAVLEAGKVYSNG